MQPMPILAPNAQKGAIMMEYVVIDVREPYEFASGHIEGAVNIPPSVLMSYTDHIDNIDKKAKIIVYCKTGSRSNVAKYFLERMGYANVINGISKEQVRAKFGL
jgi:rhodanese-related sulfurtransferase